MKSALHCNKIRSIEFNKSKTMCVFEEKRYGCLLKHDMVKVDNLRPEYYRPPSISESALSAEDRGTKRGWTELFAIPKVSLDNPRG